MITTMLLALGLACQGAPAARPANPIALAPVGVTGPTAQVPGELARLTGPDTVAVLFVPDVARLEEAATSVLGALKPVGVALPRPAELRQMLKRSVRTELEIPAGQPVLWWIDMRQPEGDEPPMGLDGFVMHQAFRIPGATEATEKAKAEIDRGEAKGRPNMPVRARERRAAVSVLPGDLVVVSSDGEPMAAPADGHGPSALLDRLPRGQVCGRLDLGRMLSENADQLRMFGGMAAMGLGGGVNLPKDATDAQRREAEMRQAYAEGMGRQLTGLIDALMQLKRASFAIDLQGDALCVSADWTRDADFPAGLDEATVNALAANLPAGLDAYAGASTSALAAVYGERFQIDDVFATLGDTPEQRQAWALATQHTQAAVAQVDGGVVGGITADADGAILAFRLKDAQAFRRDLVAAAEQLSKSGLAEVQVTQAADRLDWVAKPSERRLREIAAAFGSTPDATNEMLEKASAPLRAAITFNGSEARLSMTRGDKLPDAAAPAKGQGADLRGRLVQGGWGTADWFATIDLRGQLRRMLVPLIEEVDRSGAATLEPKVREQIDKLDKGEPVLVRARQGVMAGTARLSLELDVMQVGTLVQQIDAFGQSLSKGKRPGPDAADDDDDDDDEKDEGKRGRGTDDGT